MMARRVVVAAGLLFQLGCAWVTDAAVRFADCAEAAVDKHTRDGAAAQVSCDLQIPGSYFVVLHPAGALREQELASAGLPLALLPELRVLRIGVNPSIYVIATGPDVTGVGADRSIRSSRTTSQIHFVEIDEVMVHAGTDQPVRIEIAGSVERPVIASVH
jgi:hypothetical protein